VRLNAASGATGTAIAVAEVVKRRVPGLAQATRIGYMYTREVFEPVEEGLDVVTVRRRYPSMAIILTTLPVTDVDAAGADADTDTGAAAACGGAGTDATCGSADAGGVIDACEPGYQPPLPPAEVNPRAPPDAFVFTGTSLPASMSTPRTAASSRGHAPPSPAGSHPGATALRRASQRVPPPPPPPPQHPQPLPPPAAGTGDGASGTIVEAADVAASFRHSKGGAYMPPLGAAGSAGRESSVGGSSSGDADDGDERVATFIAGGAAPKSPSGGSIAEPGSPPAASPP